LLKERTPKAKSSRSLYPFPKTYLKTDITEKEIIPLVCPVFFVCFIVPPSIPLTRRGKKKWEGVKKEQAEIDVKL